MSRAPRPAGLTSLLRQQCARQRLRLRGGHRDLEAVLAGVAGARDVALGVGDREGAATHEGQCRDAGREVTQRADGLRALQREQRQLGQRLHRAAVADVGRQVHDVGRLAAGVDDQQQVAAAARDHQVVEQAAAALVKKP